ncbi:MAG: 2-succinyl-5-enolpyruvyl-6-hydroxy-3-cyclohexene-1-carboxylic-acid synthase [Prevotella sp.]|nr:2-succinyl-5-enolpyruvyl-6-hydroxy-3-cyclohexene-1-carboxylic-acid synthase [Prevotella sp.]
MYSNKENVNILTALLAKHGIRHAVVCPGSRNAPIVHNLNECPAIACYPVTDERSAGFYALGMAQALNEPVAVCVTSGSALLNVLPAVAEAKYQRQSLVIISADRPPQWIDQLDGQTLPQPGALGGLVTKCVTLPEPQNDDERWYCNRLVNEALLSLPACVHINVPITEHLFQFTTPELPDERIIVRMTPGTDYGCLHPGFVDALAKAERPMIVFGQSSPHNFSGEGLDFLFSHVIVLHEALAPFPSVSHFDEVLAKHGEEILPPDFVIYLGGCIVSKRLKQFLRQAKDAQVWRISPTGDVEDTFQNLRGIIVGDPEFVLQSLSDKLSKKQTISGMAYRREWLHLLTEARQHTQDYEPAYSQMATVREFEHQVPKDAIVHYANSSAIRLANIYASHHVWCNRGVNGIEGSLSTAAGHAVIADEKVFCIIGDLSFFYDQNALWNQNLRGNLRILLLNNGKGGIFDMLPGLEQCPVRDCFVSAKHHTSAEGICLQNHVDYRKAEDMQQMSEGIEWLITRESECPMLLEVFTKAEEDAKTLKLYYNLP